MLTHRKEQKGKKKYKNELQHVLVRIITPPRRDYLKSDGMAIE